MEISSSTSEGEIIEHVVLFNIKDGEDEEDHHPSKVNAMINSLHSLSSLIHLTAGPILRTRSLPSPLQFTHMLHARYPTPSLLDSLLTPISDDVISLHWPTPLPGPTPLRPGSGMRFTFLKLDNSDEKDRVFESLKKIKESLSPFVQITYGENFSDRGKGFSVAALAVFPDLNELDASEEFEDEIRLLINKFKVSDDSLIAVDYVVPRLSPVASLD